MRRRGVGRVVSARAPDVHDWVHVCVRRCVHSSACVRMHTYARMRRMHPSVGVGVCVCVCVLSGGRRATATFHQGIIVHMYIIIGARARMYTGMRALAECISARVGAGARAAGARAFTNCVSLRTFYIDVYLYRNVGTYGCIMACFCVWVCV
jgi:hypothetical protein